MPQASAKTPPTSQYPNTTISLTSPQHHKMSRRPNPSADRAAQNQQTLKSLVKLEANKSCADCKRNKHPRWASWNLGIFVCIRCSGIHRGMGTHISKVKSVDLDSWTDEQLQSMLRWGNDRANKYWEAKLAPGHVPAEAKIENFIRTKYDSKRWVMDGGMPDPSTLTSDADDDVPLSVVQEKAKVERSASLRAAAPAQRSVAPPPRQAQQNIDLFGDDIDPTPQRPSTTGPAIARPGPPKAEPAPPKQTKPADSLLGLDFFGGPPSASPARPSSNPATAATSSVPSRPDLKQSILSLYASVPKTNPQVQQQQPQVQQQPVVNDAFGGLASPSASQQQSSGMGSMNDAFGGLSFGGTSTTHQQSKPLAFSGLSNFTSPRSPPSHTTSSAFGGGGDFFSPQQKQQKPGNIPRQQSETSSNLGDFSSLSNPSNTTNPKPAPVTSSGMGDLFDLSAPANPPVPPKPAVPSSPPMMSSPFNLSQAAPKPQAQTAYKPQAVSAASFSSNNLSNMDAWGSNDAWASDPAPAPKAPQTQIQTQTQNDFGGWGSSVVAPSKPLAPKVTQDDDFGGWSSAPPVSQNTTHNNPPPKQGGGFGSGGEDLFSNVWE